MDNFEVDDRRRQEIIARPYWDVIYYAIWGDGIKIVRGDFDIDGKLYGGYELDKFFAVDVVIRFPNGQILTGQEKALSWKYRDRETVTCEFEQVARSEDKDGDWFKLPAQFVALGYLTAAEEEFDIWVVTDWCRMVLAAQTYKIIWENRKNDNGSAQASFKFTNIENLPKETLLACSWKEDK